MLGLEVPLQQRNQIPQHDRADGDGKPWNGQLKRSSVDYGISVRLSPERVHVLDRMAEQERHAQEHRRAEPPQRLPRWCKQVPVREGHRTLREEKDVFPAAGTGPIGVNFSQRRAGAGPGAVYRALKRVD